MFVKVRQIIMDHPEERDRIYQALRRSPLLSLSKIDYDACTGYQKSLEEISQLLGVPLPEGALYNSLLSDSQP